jgi:hypothetical protein
MSGRMTPNPGINRSAQRRRRWVPVALRTPAPGYAQRWASGRIGSDRVGVYFLAAIKESRL